MTLQEAIKAIGNRPIGVDPDSSWHLNAALLILVEAGKRLQQKRLDHWVLITPLLPGETKE